MCGFILTNISKDIIEDLLKKYLIFYKKFKEIFNYKENINQKI